MAVDTPPGMVEVEVEVGISSNSAEVEGWVVRGISRMDTEVEEDHYIGDR